jgi:hypothetical protein
VTGKTTSTTRTFTLVSFIVLSLVTGCSKGPDLSDDVTYVTLSQKTRIKLVDDGILRIDEKYQHTEGWRDTRVPYASNDTGQYDIEDTFDEIPSRAPTILAVLDDGSLRLTNQDGDTLRLWVEGNPVFEAAFEQTETFVKKDVHYCRAACSMRELGAEKDLQKVGVSNVNVVSDGSALIRFADITGIEIKGDGSQWDAWSIDIHRFSGNPSTSVILFGAIEDRDHFFVALEVSLGNWRQEYY